MKKPHPLLTRLYNLSSLPLFHLLAWWVTRRLVYLYICIQTSSECSYIENTLFWLQSSIHPFPTRYVASQFSTNNYRSKIVTWLEFQITSCFTWYETQFWYYFTLPSCWWSIGEIWNSSMIEKNKIVKDERQKINI